MINVQIIENVNKYPNAEAENFWRELGMCILNILAYLKTPWKYLADILWNWKTIFEIEKASFIFYEMQINSLSIIHLW